MPIKRENQSRYPSDWAVISSRIRFERAGGRCQFPVVPQCMGSRTH